MLPKLGVNCWPAGGYRSVTAWVPDFDSHRLLMGPPHLHRYTLSTTLIIFPK